jgi:anti-sigma regulatory factor (Ser/Thr protein kinase)
VNPPGLTGEPRLDLRLSAEPNSIALARAAVTDLAERADAPAKALAEIAVAVSEACTNVVLHAYRGMEAGVMEVSGEVRESLLTVVVSDDGVGMGARVDSPGLGLGLPTIAALASRFEVRPGPRGRGTALRMTFLLDPTRASGGPVRLDLI